MQNYNQQPQGYQRPGSTASFAGQGAPPPPPYGGAKQGYQSASPSTNSQWAPPAQNTRTAQPQWNQASQQGNWGQQQTQQAAGGYNPGTYGVMPGAYGQTQQQDMPPPPPPKPPGFAAAVSQQQQTQQASQNWGQQPTYGQQQGQQNYQSPLGNTGFTPQGQGGVQQQGGSQNQGASQQPYNTAAPPPLSQTPGGSYFPPPQGRPGSIYGAEQAGTYSTPSSAVAQHPPNTVLSPNEQQPAYIPPSLTGQGVQSYMPANTNPMPGVYIPPPPDIPAWQQANHAPLQGGVKKFRYTKPTVDPSFYSQGYQPPQQQQFPQQQMPPQQPMQPQQSMQPPQPLQTQQPQQPYTQQMQSPVQHQGQMQPGQFVPPNQPIQQQFIHGAPQQDQFQQQQPQPQPQPQPQQYNQAPQGQQMQQPPVQQYQQQGNQWQQSPLVDQGYVQQPQNVQVAYGAQQQPPINQQAWQTGHQVQESVVSQQHPHLQDSHIQAPKPIGRTGTTPPNFINETSPQSQPVSPILNRHSVSFGTGHNIERTGSVSSIVMSAIGTQQPHSTTATSSPAPSIQQKVPTPPPPRDQKSAFSALGAGGPSDWERFADIDEEVDDEELFGAKKEEKKNDNAHSHSVELPGSQPSPPHTTESWPTPPSQPAPPNVGIQRRETFQPTPPPKSTDTPFQRPPSQPSQQTFVMGDVLVSAQSPPPAHVAQPPPAPQSFVMGDGGWASQAQQKQQTHVQAIQSTPAQQQHPPPASNQFVMNDGGWAAQAQQQQRQQTPIQARQTTPTQPQQPPPSNNPFVMDGGGRGAVQQPPSQAPSAWGTQGQNEVHAAELKAKDEAYERLMAEGAKDKADLRAEIERLKSDLENTKSHAAGEKTVLNEQLESMRVAVDKTKSDADMLRKEKDSTIDRLHEDAEGRDDLLKEKDATIADLKRQLDVEKTKEPPKPTAADIVPDIDPWYAGSLERYIHMLRSEATELQVEDKIRAFTGFLKSESAVRGLEYYPTPPPTAPAEEPISRDEPVALSRGVSDASTRKSMHVLLPQESFVQEELTQYSPGGRPVMQAKPTFRSNDSTTSQQSFVMSSRPDHQAEISSNRSTTILTPTSSTDDDFNKTPIQSPPEEQPKPQYKAYVPSVATSTPAESVHRQSLSFATPPSIPPSQSKTSDQHDEIFFEKPLPPKPDSRPTTSASTASDVPLPAPLSYTSQSSATPAPKQDSLEALANLLPKQISSAQMNPGLEEIRKQSQMLPSDFSYINELTTTWEKATALARRKNDTARQKRQEDSEARTDQLFNDNEISYADIGAIEEQFKEKERQLKAQEDRNEYKMYVEDVFDKVYDSIQADIKSLMDLYIETESLLHSSISGTKALENTSAPTTEATLELLRDLHVQIEARHEKVVTAVSERDKRYKKTEVQPLYQAGNIAKMKNVEKHFENAEKQAIVRAKSEKAERAGELVRFAEEVVVRAVGVEQNENDMILAAIRDLSGNEEGREPVLGKARETLFVIKASSKSLLSFFNSVEVDLNTAVFEAEMAQAKAEVSDAGRVEELEKEMAEGEKKLRDELTRRVGVLEQDSEEVEGLLEGKGLKRELSEEEVKKRRMQAALQEAKRRNGEL